MTETQLPGHLSFVRPVLDVLSDGEVWQTLDIRREVEDRMDLTAEQRAATLNSGQTRAYNRIGWALHFATRAGAVEKVAHGQSRITDYGRQLLSDHPVEITREVLESAPEYWNYTPKPRLSDLNAADSDDLPTHWFVGAVFGEDGGEAYDHTEEFRRDGIWRAAQPHSYSDKIKSMKPGERIAVKAAFTRKHDLPFEIGGATASVMAIRATGTIVANHQDGDSVDVEWDPPEAAPEEDWYFWTSRSTVWGVKADNWTAKALIAFAFDGADQDYDRFLSVPYWAEKYFSDVVVDEPDETDDAEELDPDPVYGVAEIVEEGCFVPEPELQRYLNSLRRKKNLILQGPPGTGKTWLAKRLGYAIIGRKDRSLIHAVQFHPTVSYEDFVRGWRPGGDGKLVLTDGYFLKVIEAAQAEPDTDHVLVIEEINRANLAQVLGELLTLLEADKRKASEALKLAYSKANDEPVYIPENLYLIGTMNLADRSLAIVDFALRRRFAFADLRPQFNSAWRGWVSRRNGVDEGVLLSLASHIETLNRSIAAEFSLGEQYCIGHSFFTPGTELPIDDPQEWVRSVVEEEIRPLLSEYWFDDPTRVEDEAASLIGLT